MAKHILHNDVDLFDFVLIGIACPENQYVIINNINLHLNINLSLSQTLKFDLKKHDLFEFSLFHYVDEELGLEYSVVPNKSNYRPMQNKDAGFDLFANSDQVIEETALLINELPHTNYFFILKGESAIHEQYNVFKLLKSIPVINQVHEIIPDKLPSKNNLIF